MDDTPNSEDQSSTRNPQAEAAAIAGKDQGRVAQQAGPPDVLSGEVASATDQEWLPLFPFDEPYDQQIQGINGFLDTLQSNGFFAVEGACGTGKTLIALCGAVYAMQSDSVTIDGETTPLSEFKRAVAVTPVKQQLKQFILEVRTINRNLPADSSFSPVSGIVLRGMNDMLAYRSADDFDFDAELTRALAKADDNSLDSTSSSRDRIKALRTTARELIKAGSHVGLDWKVTEPETCSAPDCRHYVGGPQMSVCPYHSQNDQDEDAPWYDIVRAERVVELVESLDGERLSVNGVETPYPNRLPAVVDVIESQSESGLSHPKAPFDPFYVKAISGLSTVSFADGDANVLDREALVSASAGEGSCPHVVMGNLAGKADVVIGNYNHLFDPETRQLTAGKAGLFGEKTILVVDEAHRVEGRVRDMLSDDVSPYGLQRAYKDIVTALQIINKDVGEGTPEAQMRSQATAREVLAELSTDWTLSTDSLERALDFTEWLIDALGEMVSEYLQSEYRHWKAAIGDGKPSRDSIALDTPDDPTELDDLRERLKESSSWNRDYLEKFARVCRAAARIHDEVEVSERETVCESTGRMFRRWQAGDRVEQYREIVIEHSPHKNPPSRLPDWIEFITARFHLFNTLPTDRVAALYDENGGGITMSATLEPLDDYRQTAGLDPLTETDEDDLAGVPPAQAIVTPSEFADRPVNTTTYELAFPMENRSSWVVDVPKYTSKKRGKPTQDWGNMTSTRQQYARAMADITSSYGNHLLAMPNYREAQWAGEWLEDHVGKPVYVDQSSSSEATTEMLQSFFNDEHAIFITSSLGTVTEGVDYDGEKLHCATVVGVPYRNIATGRSQAVIDAYDRKVADESQSGFETAVAIPAVRKARQAIGRVLRAPSETGVRIFLDRRYGQRGPYKVGQHLSSAEFDEFQTIQPDMLSHGLSRFWEEH